MQFNIKHQSLLIATAMFMSSPVFAVDLIGVHDLAVKNDPRLQAAAYRRDATAENKRQAWANLLPTLSGSASMNRGNTEVSVMGNVVSDSDIDNESYGLSFRQSLYAQSNYENLDIARGQVSQASDGRAVKLAVERASARASRAWIQAVASSIGNPMARRLKPAGKNQEGKVKC